MFKSPVSSGFEVIFRRMEQRLYEDRVKAEIMESKRRKAQEIEDMEKHEPSGTSEVNAE